MKINLNNVKNIDLCYENCEVDTIFYHNLLGINIQRKLKAPYTYRDKPTHRIKTFEIALQDTNNVLKDTGIMLRTDLAQLTINYLDGSFEHFFVIWGEKDCTWSYSSLQKVNKNNNKMSLTSNCESMFLT